MRTNGMPSISGKIALLHHVGGGNLGDDATLDTVIQSIKRYRPGASLAAFTVNPDDTKERHRLPCYPIRTTKWSFGYAQATPKVDLKSVIRTLVHKYPFLFHLARLGYALTFRLPKTLYSELSFLITSRRILKSFELLIISGGGQLTEWGGPWAFPYTLFKWVMLAKSAHVKCFFLNVGAGPLDHSLSKLFVRRALWAADYVSFRDDQSRMLVSRIGFKGSWKVFPDCVYIRKIPAPTNPNRENSGRLIVGIAPMPYCDPRVDPAEKNQALYQSFIEKLASFTVLLARNSYELALFGTDIGVDPLAIKDLQQSLLSHGLRKIPQHKPVQSIDDLISSMSVLDYVVTCRFHGVIFAHLLNKPVLALSHHPKVMTLMNNLGLSKYCVDIRTFDHALLANTFASLVDNTDDIKNQMAGMLAKYRSQLMDQFEKLFAGDVNPQAEVSWV